MVMNLFRRKDLPVPESAADAARRLEEAQAREQAIIAERERSQELAAIRSEAEQAEAEIHAARVAEAFAAYRLARIAELEPALEYFELLGKAALAGERSVQANTAVVTAAKAVAALGEPMPGRDFATPGVGKVVAAAEVAGAIPPRPSSLDGGQRIESPHFELAARARAELNQLRAGERVTPVARQARRGPTMPLGEPVTANA